MLTWRSRKQLTIIIILAAPFVGLSLFVLWWFLPKASCSDSRQNQGELGIDCGGPCRSCALIYPKPIVPYWARAVPVRPNLVDAAAEIENPNELLSSRRVEYEFILSDQFGSIAKRTGWTFLYPQERFIVVESGIEVTRKPTRVDFKIISADWHLQNDPKPVIAVEQREYRVEETEGRRISAVNMTLRNDTAFDFAQVEVGIAILDANENLVGANRILAENLFSGQRREMKSIWPYELTGDVDIIFIDPRVNIFDPSLRLPPR